MPALFLEVAARAALIALATACVLRAFRIRTAATRHAAWTTVVIAMLLLPIWSFGGPRILLPVMPAREAVDVGPATADPAPDPSTPRDLRGSANSAFTPAGATRGVRVFASVYLLGAVVLLVRLATGTVHARRLRRGAVVHDGVLTSDRCATPITVGWLAPVLILPRGWKRWPAAQLDAVLAHEREHARRHDPLVQWLALLNRAIFWFHPLAWWLERRLASLAEEACDAAVIRAGHSPQDYSEYLIEMAHALRRHGRRLNIAGMAMPGGGLSDRLQHIFEEALMTPTPRTRAICTLVFCMTSSVIFAAGVLMPRSPAERPNNATNFSGRWTHVSSTYAGRGRGGTGAGTGEREVKVTIASGAPVNCGTDCTIVQNASTLTISRTDPPGTIPPDVGVVTLHLDGSESRIMQANGAAFAARAKDDGGTLVVTRDFTNLSSVRQTLSIQDGRLKVVTMFSAADAPVTMTYVRR